MVHDAALIEIADELVHAVLVLQGAHPLDAVIGIAEYAHLAVHIGIGHPLDARQHLAEGLETFDVGLPQRPQSLGGLAQKAQ